MKLKYIFAALISAVMFYCTGCQVEEERFLEEVQVSQSTIAIPATGGQVTITVNAVASWSLEADKIPAWLTVSPASGSAGSTEVVFSAGETKATNEVLLTLLCQNATQILNVVQIADKVETPITSCADILSGAEVGKTYKAKGSVTDITNYNKYGCFYINDGTGTVYVYGSMNSKDFNIEVGDIVTFEGPWTSYGNFDDVTILELEKSLIKVDEIVPEEALLPKEGGEFSVVLTCKGDGLNIVIPDEVSSWIAVKGMSTSGTTVTVSFAVAANELGDRSGKVKFVTTSGGTEYSAEATITQEGSILDASIADFLAAAEGETQYRVKGIIKSIDVNTQYHNAGIYITNGTGTEVQLYRTAAKDGNIEDLGLKVGDQITVVGKRSSYNGKPQMAAGGVVEAYEKYTTATIAEFVAAAEDDTKYSITGKITDVSDLSDSYNNVKVTITDGTNTVVLYRMTTVDGAKVSTLNLEVGGTITAAGKRSSYNDAIQMAAGGVCQFYTAPTAGGDEGGEGDENANYTSNVNMPAADFADSDNAAYGGVAVIGGKEYPVIKIGKSSAGGKYVLSNLPKTGDVTLSFWGVAWKGKTCALTLTVEGAKIDGADSKTIDLAANNGATGNQPYTITFAASDFYSVKLTGVTASTKVTLSTADSGPRCILTGVNVN